MNAPNNKQNRSIDDMIRDALQPTDETLDELVHRTEPSIFAMTGSVLRGRQWWVNIPAFLFTLVFFAAAIFTAVKFFQVETVRDQIMCATGFMMFMMMVMALKLWFWMVMNRNAVTREVKRVELQIASLRDSMER